MLQRSGDDANDEDSMVPRMGILEGSVGAVPVVGPLITTMDDTNTELSNQSKVNVGKMGKKINPE